MRQKSAATPDAKAEPGLRRKVTTLIFKDDKKHKEIISYLQMQTRSYMDRYRPHHATMQISLDARSLKLLISLYEAFQNGR